ncbi:hypothetical protein PG993_010858 [Apiospora rasikravindrae]|uniref:Uncharacterized protein n=1 Tax=Apiospora rasikravindrae TaxID=990691 RepID=A0ABR1SCK4_9PEZI
MPPISTQPPPTTAVHVFLRRVALVQYAFCWVLLLAHGIAAGRALPALGLLPLTASALLSGVLLHRDALAAAGSPVQTSLSAQNVLYCDLVVAGVQLTLLIFSWIDLSDRYGEASLTILGTYGTVFMMVDCGIHFYFALREIFHTLLSPKCHCPHCRSVHGRGRGGICLPDEDEYTPLQSDVGDDSAPQDASEQV